MRTDTGGRTRSGAAEGLVPELPSGYRYLGVLGEGGMGFVFKALDEVEGGEVAIKSMRAELREDKHARALFAQEGLLAAALRHPNVVSLRRVAESGGEVYLVFEHVEGVTLADLLHVRGRLSSIEIRQVIEGLCAALCHLHRHGIIHCDVKPSNIMITSRGEVKLMDFGISRRTADDGPALPASDAELGTPQYMAPEQERGEVRPESDVFSAGACLYEMATGKRPFAAWGSSLVRLEGLVDPPSKHNPDLPAALDRLILDCLKPDPDERIRSADELLKRALETLGGGVN